MDILNNIHKNSMHQSGPTAITKDLTLIQQASVKNMTTGNQVLNGYQCFDLQRVCSSDGKSDADVQGMLKCLSHHHDKQKTALVQNNVSAEQINQIGVGACLLADKTNGQVSTTSAVTGIALSKEFIPSCETSDPSFNAMDCYGQKRVVYLLGAGNTTETLYGAASNDPKVASYFNS